MLAIVGVHAVSQAVHADGLFVANPDLARNARHDLPAKRFAPSDPALHIVNLNWLLELNVEEHRMGRFWVIRTVLIAPGKVRNEVRNTAKFYRSTAQDHAFVVRQFLCFVVQLNHALLIPVRDNAPVQIFVGGRLVAPVLKDERFALHVPVIVQMLPDGVAAPDDGGGKRVGDIERRNRQPCVPGKLHFRARVQAPDARILEVNALVVVRHFRARGLFHNVHRPDVCPALRLKRAGDHALNMRRVIVAGVLGVVPDEIAGRHFKILKLLPGISVLPTRYGRRSRRRSCEQAHIPNLLLRIALQSKHRLSSLK